MLHNGSTQPPPQSFQILWCPLIIKHRLCNNGYLKNAPRESKSVRKGHQNLFTAFHTEEQDKLKKIN